MAKTKKSPTGNSPAKSAGKSSTSRPPRPPRNDGFVEEGTFLTTNQGALISDNHNSLKVGPRGPTLLEDFVLREKITSFDHERIPERVVHARGAGAFGYFECTKDIGQVSMAGLFTQVGKKTPVLVRFSTVAGSRGSMDTARDVRGFAVKFYTDEGNFDLVGNNIPVFFIQDAMKFPDLIHAVKPEQDNEIPQAQSAHDTFWDFVSLMPESLHMQFWAMSDRAIPRSYRMMEGFGVHTFRLVNKKGEATFVKFHWKPKLGVHSLLWEESQQLGGLDPDFHRRDLFESISKGNFPEWELGVQLIPESDEFKFPFDLLDATKLVPEELVPVQKIGKLVLNRNPDNFFSEIEQVAFHPGHIVPGIDFTNDPLLQGRLFSYTDTQLTRLGGPNFHELPVNRTLAGVNNNNRDGFGQHLIPQGKVAYEPNSLKKGGCPFHAGADKKTLVQFTERMSAQKVRARSSSFGDHISQAKLFFDSQNEVEQKHIENAFSFELSKVNAAHVRNRVVNLLMFVNENLAKNVAQNVGAVIPKTPVIPPNPADPENNIVPDNLSQDAAAEDQPNWKPKTGLPKKSTALSIVLNNKKLVETRKIALLVGSDTDAASLKTVQSALKAQGVGFELVVPHFSREKENTDAPVVEQSLSSTPSHAFDGVFALVSPKSYAKPKDVGLAVRFIGQAFKHCKTIGGIAASKGLIDEATFGMALKKDAPGVVIADGPQLSTSLNAFLKSLGEHRHWAREEPAQRLPF